MYMRMVLLICICIIAQTAAEASEATYYFRPDCKVLELPYKGKAMSMFLLLPLGELSIADFVKNSITSSFNAIRNPCTPSI